ncbi:MAG: 2OG-Fe(II) oxygenase [Pseudomonadota bacterium]
MNLGDRIMAFDWTACEASLDTDGYTMLPAVLNHDECGALAALYGDPDTDFRATINMARHNFGRGEYRYFDHPLPAAVAELRAAFYPHLARIANDWSHRLGDDTQWPDELEGLLDLCHRGGQRRPTPLLLRYRTGDYNCLHQDLYGDIQFPLQVIVQLSARGKDFDGGELVLVEQRPRMQSRPIVVDLPQGAAAIVPVRYRPVRGARGWRRTQMRHGVSAVTAGTRQTLGLIFHDAA